MPLYEYQCDACEHRFERIQKFSDELVSTCPVCEGPVRKLVSSPAIQFKGTGWYITDYARSGKEGAASSKDEASEKKEESGGKSSSESDAKASSDAGKKPSAPKSPSTGSGDSSAASSGSTASSGPSSSSS